MHVASECRLHVELCLWVWSGVFNGRQYSVVGYYGVPRPVCTCFTVAAGDSSRLQAGTHRYPFTILLPPSAPSSFEGAVGHVRYTVEATMDRPRKSNHVSRSAFTVISLVDLNLESPELTVISRTCTYTQLNSSK